MTYVYTGPSTLAIIGIAVLSAVVTAGTLYGLWWLEDWWNERRLDPGPVEPALDGVEPAGRADDAPFPDVRRERLARIPAIVTLEATWTPSQEDVELGRALVRERFGKGS